MQIKTLPTLSNFGAIFWCHLFFYNVNIFLVPGSKILLKHCIKLRKYSWTSKNSEPSALCAPLNLFSWSNSTSQDLLCCIEYKVVLSVNDVVASGQTFEPHIHPRDWVGHLQRVSFGDNFPSQLLHISYSFVSP